MSVRQLNLSWIPLYSLFCHCGNSLAFYLEHAWELATSIKKKALRQRKRAYAKIYNMSSATTSGCARKRKGMTDLTERPMTEPQLTWTQNSMGNNGSKPPRPEAPRVPMGSHTKKRELTTKQQLQEEHWDQDLQELGRTHRLSKQFFSLTFWFTSRSFIHIDKTVFSCCCRLSVNKF